MSSNTASNSGIVGVILSSCGSGGAGSMDAKSLDRKKTPKSACFAHNSLSMHGVALNWQVECVMNCEHTSS